MKLQPGYRLETGGKTTSLNLFQADKKTKNLEMSLEELVGRFDNSGRSQNLSGLNAKLRGLADNCRFLFIVRI